MTRESDEAKLAELIDRRKALDVQIMAALQDRHPLIANEIRRLRERCSELERRVGELEKSTAEDL